MTLKYKSSSSWSLQFKGQRSQLMQNGFHTLNKKCLLTALQLGHLCPVDTQNFQFIHLFKFISDMSTGIWAEISILIGIMPICDKKMSVRDAKCPSVTLEMSVRDKTFCRSSKSCSLLQNYIHMSGKSTYQTNICNEKKLSALFRLDRKNKRSLTSEETHFYPVRP